MKNSAGSFLIIHQELNSSKNSGTPGSGTGEKTMRTNFEYMTNLQYKVKALQAQVDAFQSGEAYLRQKEEYEKRLREKDRIIAALKKELGRSHAETVTMRDRWMEVFEDLEKEHRKAMSKEQKKTARMEQRMLAAEKSEDRWHEKWKEQQVQLYAVQTELEEEKEKNRKITAQVNKNFENSSIPSSMQVGRKKIPNSWVKTGKRPGGQPGHKGHRRKLHVPTETHEIPAPKKYQDSPDYYETGKVIRKQKVEIHLGVRIIEYATKEYRDRRTGARVHAPFPAGYENEVNYGGSIKALAFLLGNEGNVSHGKIRKLIEELTEGEIRLSDGMINGLCREFSEKTKEEKQEIIKKLMTSPVMNADFTNANVNGGSAQVLVLASPQENVALYIGREKKGHEGVKGTPLEDYVGTVVHDHDKTFYRYGIRHQECLQHDCRYLIGSKENEPERKWNQKMHELIREMLHYRNSLDEKEELDPAKVSGLEARYDEILREAEEEYEADPPSEYYKEGYNLFRRLKEYKESELLFLHDKRVPANNSLCERLARVFKRKQKQAMVFRSHESLDYTCDGLSIVHLLRTKDDSVYQRIAEIFERKKPTRLKKNVAAEIMA